MHMQHSQYTYMMFTNIYIYIYNIYMHKNSEYILHVADFSVVMFIEVTCTILFFCVLCLQSRISMYRSTIRIRKYPSGCNDTPTEETQ